MDTPKTPAVLMGDHRRPRGNSAAAAPRSNCSSKSIFTGLALSRQKIIAGRAWEQKGTKLGGAAKQGTGDGANRAESRAVREPRDSRAGGD
ncbi:hypothetical protein NL676_005742 [Syzygium grande]|nr:hypothetical protein NL676_005742 [Syzygium grande]